jgi:7-carboxy-7-deazaguanine synthase
MENDMTVKTIPLCEVFGPTLQGEGALAGRPTYFVRVGGCDYSCNWCDTDIAVLPELVRKLPRVDQELIFRQLRELPKGPKWVTISGGNPAMYELGDFVKRCHHTGYSIAVETQGSRFQDWLMDVDMLTISPKPPSSGLDPQKSIDNLAKFMGNLKGKHSHQICLKVIVFDDNDYEFARMVRQSYIGVDFYLSVGTAMGGLHGDFLPSPMEGERSTFEQIRLTEDTKPTPPIKEVIWNPSARTDDVKSLLARWRWLADIVKGDPLMADAAIFPQTHALIWGIHTRGV